MMQTQTHLTAGGLSYPGIALQPRLLMTGRWGVDCHGRAWLLDSNLCGQSLCSPHCVYFTAHADTQRRAGGHPAHGGG
jgi:hypothetical protein